MHQAVNGKMHEKDEDTASLGADILNPFVHRLELDTTYDKLKVSYTDCTSHIHYVQPPRANRSRMPLVREFMRHKCHTHTHTLRG